MTENQKNRTTAILNIVLKASADEKALEYLDKIANNVCHAVLLEENKHEINKHLTFKEIDKEKNKIKKRDQRDQVTFMVKVFEQKLLPMLWVTNPNGRHGEVIQCWVGDQFYFNPPVGLNDLVFLLDDVSDLNIDDRYKYKLSIDTYNKLKKLIECFRQNKRPSKKIWAWLIGDEAETASDSMESNQTKQSH